MHISWVTACTLAAVIATFDFLFDDCSFTGRIGIVDRLGCIRKFVFSDWLFAILDKCLHIGVEISQRLCILLRDAVSEILRERV
jgi:hypothetical protein